MIAALAAACAGAVIGMLGAATAAIVVGGLAVAIVGFARPGWLVYGAVFFAPLHVYRVEIEPGNLSLFRGLILVAALGLVLRWAAGLGSATRSSDYRPLVIWSCAAVAFLSFEGLVALPRSGTELGGTFFQIHAFFFFAAGVIAFAITTGAVQRSKLVVVALVSAIPQLLLVAQQRITASTGGLQELPFLTSSDISEDINRAGVTFGQEFRPAGTFSDPNWFGIFAAMTFILADEMARRSRGPWARGALVALRLGLVAGLLVSLSRSGIVIVAAYLIVSRLPDLSLPRLARTLGIAVLSGLLLLVFLQPYLSLSTLEERVQDPISNAVHRETRKVALDEGREHLLTGIGLANLGRVLGQPADRSSAHAEPFTLFAEQGLIGLLLVACALVPPAVAALRHRGVVGAGLGIGVGVAIWTYDFVFVLNVAAVWWALLMMSSIRQGVREHAYSNIAQLERPDARASRIAA